MNALRPSRRFRTVAALSAALVIALSAGLADARAGKTSSSGSRGSRTGDAPAATSTAPNTAQPMERSMTPPSSAAQPGMNQPGMANAGMQRPASGGFFSRGGFMGAVMGGLLGAGIAGLLFGGGFFSGLEGFAGILGFALQALLVVVLVKLAINFFRRRSQQQQGGAQPAYAGGMANNAGGMPNTNAAPDTAHSPRQGLGGLGGLGGGMAGGLGGLMGGASAAPAQRRTAHDDIGIGPEDYAAFERLLIAVQDAYSREDNAALRTLATLEMATYFAGDLAANTERGVLNRVSDVKLLQGDLSEAWAEGTVEYATVALRFSCTDVTVERAGGRVVDGNANQPTEATELWTFTRPRGGAWVLSAIQQAH